MKILLLILLSILLVGCSEHKVDSYEGWCEQITGVNLQEKYEPWWSVVFSVSFDANAIRDDYTEKLNNIYLVMVEHRAPKMAWRDGVNLHLVNASSFMNVEPNVFISQWQKAVQDSINNRKIPSIEECIPAVLTSMFDNLYIHTIEIDALGNVSGEKITKISTEREARLGDKRL